MVSGEELAESCGDLCYVSNTGTLDILSLEYRILCKEVLVLTDPKDDALERDLFPWSDFPFCWSLFPFEVLIDVIVSLLFDLCNLGEIFSLSVLFFFDFVVFVFFFNILFGDSISVRSCNLHSVGFKFSSRHL